MIKYSLKTNKNHYNPDSLIRYQNELDILNSTHISHIDIFDRKNEILEFDNTEDAYKALKILSDYSIYNSFCLDCNNTDIVKIERLVKTEIVQKHDYSLLELNLVSNKTEITRKNKETLKFNLVKIEEENPTVFLDHLIKNKTKLIVRYDYRYMVNYEFVNLEDEDQRWFYFIDPEDKIYNQIKSNPDKYVIIYTKNI